MKTRPYVLIFLIILVFIPSSVFAQEGSGKNDRAAVTRITTLTVQPYLPFQSATMHIQEDYSGSLGSVFEYQIDNSYKAYIFNVGFSSNAGASCSYDPAILKVSCTGTINQVVIDYDYIDTADDFIGSDVWWGWGGNSNYPMDCTIYLYYPSPLVYLRSYIGTPTEITSTRITWHAANANELYGYGLFHDPRVSATFLPLILR